MRRLFKIYIALILAIVVIGVAYYVWSKSKKNGDLPEPQPAPQPAPQLQGGRVDIFPDIIQSDLAGIVR